MATEALLVLFFLALVVVGGLVLYLLVERESDATETMRRADAENEVRRDR
jgi:hypothetical protein